MVFSFPALYAGLAALAVLVQSTSAQINCQGGTLSIVAHADDDILFQTPYLFQSLSARCLTTAFITAGDAGYGMDYAVSRERGNEAAKAEFLNVTNSWGGCIEVSPAI